MHNDSIITFAEFAPSPEIAQGSLGAPARSIAELEALLQSGSPSLIVLCVSPDSPTLSAAIERCHTLRPTAPIWLAPIDASPNAPDWLRPRLLSALGHSGAGAEAAARMEALTQLAGGIAHDFNNLLTAIRCYSEILHEELTDSAPELRDRTAEIFLATQRAALMSRQLLAFSGRATVHPERINLQEWLPWLSSLLRSILDEQISLSLHSPELAVWIEADRNQLEQVVTNLVINAREAMPQGGELEIRASQLTLTTRNPAQLPAGDYVEIHVSDTGGGVSPEVLPRLFEPFASTKPRGRGLGLGLATAQLIVRRQGGEIIHETREGGGTRFRVVLPSSRPAGEGTRPASSPLPRGSGQRILVAEDDPAIRAVATALLTSLGYQVDSASTGAEAVEQLRRNPDHPYAALLSDISMPGMNGYELAANALALQPTTAVVLMSGYAGDPGVIQSAQELGALFLEKPFSRESLGQRVAEGLARRAPS
jgi:signal transduction histidine kinase